MSKESNKAEDFADQNIFLMAEDNPSDVELVTQMLSKAFGSNYEIVCVDSFSKIISALNKGEFTALILDMNLPDQSGVLNITYLVSKYPELPIVVLTGQENIDSAYEALQSGAQDYLSKNNVTAEILQRSLRYAKERKQIENRLKMALEFADLRNIQLESLAKHDPLTRLPNRAYFHESALRTLNSSDRENKPAALLYFDLNGFKKVNDTYGHLIGDQLLKQVSKRMAEVVRDSDMLARLGGDEFVVITDLLQHKSQVYPLVKRILGQFNSPFEIEGHQVVASTSIGVAFYPNADNLDLLVKHADCAMYKAKKSKDSDVCFYTEKMASQFSRTQDIELEIGKALENDQIFATFQPITPLGKNKPVMLEALARWTSPKLGHVPADEFIGVAEYTPAINGITRAVIKHTGFLIEKLNDLNLDIKKISINVCSSQLSSSHFCKLLFEWIKIHNIPAESVCIELTERQLIERFEECKKQVVQLKNHGIKMSLDDFGSGFSSIAHLLGLPFDYLKIDRRLIQGIDKNEKNQALVAGVIEMAHRLNMEVIAEGVEERAEMDALEVLKCDYIQGYYIAKPMSIDDIATFYGNKTS